MLRGGNAQNDKNTNKKSSLKKKKKENIWVLVLINTANDELGGRNKIIFSNLLAIEE